MRVVLFASAMLMATGQALTLEPIDDTTTFLAQTNAE